MIRRRIGIDTSILVRLVTEDPPATFRNCVDKLLVLIEEQGCEVFASNQVVGETYATLRHHYGASDHHARIGLLRTFDSGLVVPLNGQAVIEALSATGGPGVFDRLIADDYSRSGLEALTLDRKMGSLPGARTL